jgi:hypothetical protein
VQIHAHHRTFYEDCHPDFDDKDLGTPWPVHTKYGDGTEIPDDDIARIRKAVRPYFTIENGYSVTIS